ncbi:MAG: PAS domain S-box protein, partial [bacterium]
TPSETPFEAKFLKKDGASFPVEIHSRLLPMKNHLVQVTAIRDITSRKSADEAIRNSEALYRQMFEKNRAVKLLLDPLSGAIVQANSAACEFYGYSRAQLKAMKIMDINTLPEMQIREAMEQAAAEQKRYFVFKHRLASGAVKDVEIYTGPIKVRGRELLYSIIIDITDRKDVEKKLRQIVEATSSFTGKDFFRSLVRSLANTLEVRHAFISELADTRNLQLRTIAHWDGQEFRPQEVYAIKDSPSEHILKKKVVFVPAKIQEHYPNDTWLKDNQIDAYIAISLFDSAGMVLGALGIMHDQPMNPPLLAESVLKIFAARAVNEIERTRAEKALRESEEKYRRFFEEDLTGDFISTSDGRLISCNPAFAKIFGFASIEEALKVDVFSLYPNHAERKKLMKKLMREKKLDSVEVEFLHTSGRPIYAIENVIGEFDDAGNLTKMRGYIFDITERKTLEDQLLHSQKMEAVGRLAGGVAHDFNNLLTAITGYSELILKNLEEEEFIQNEVEEVKKACEIGGSLTSQLLTFSRRQVRQPRLLDLNKVITDLNKLLKRLVGENIELDFLMEDNLGYIRVDLGQLKQVVMNLAVNSVDAMPRGGKLIIETKKCVLERKELHENERIEAGEYVLLSMRDTGYGMDEETQSHIFEPFFTTKELGKGTGLGLATVYGILKQSGGYIEATSTSGQGTKITAYFPLVDEHEATQELELADFKIRRGVETILLVEDEAAVRQVTKLILAKNGYSVLDARNADEALSKYTKHNGAIDLLISDMVMPGMNGQELAHKFKGILPEIKVLFISGYVDNDVFYKNGPEIADPFLQKPYSPDSLLMKVQEVLGN